MSSNVPTASPEERDRAYRSRVKAESRPAAIVDLETSAVIAANAGGLDILGITPADRLPFDLDATMPAIIALRSLELDDEKSRFKELIFWRFGRTSTQTCHLTPADSNCRAHVVIVFESGADENSVTPSAAARSDPRPLVTSNMSGAANDDEPGRVEREDSETLKEIARRIVDGEAIKTSTTSEANGAAAIIESPSQPQPTASQPGNGALPNAIQPAHNRDGPPFTALEPEVIAKLAHELKTPLTAIAAAAEIMRDERLGAMQNPKYLGYAADIHNSATHALNVIANMLTTGVSASDASTPIDLAEIASRSISSLQPLASSKSLTLRLDDQPGLPPVWGDATAIEQVLLNLLTNALKFTPAGGEIRVATGDLDDGAVFIVVRDTGDGMSDAALALALSDGEPDHKMRPGGGRGMGLRLARRLCADMGAEFEIDSAIGRGTVVMVSFPQELLASGRT